MATYETLTSDVIDLSGLSPRQRRFLQEAQDLAAGGMAWADFQRFYMQADSPLWFADGDPQAGRLSHEAVLTSALFCSLKDLWLRLGQAQGFLER